MEVVYWLNGTTLTRSVTRYSDGSCLVSASNPWDFYCQLGTWPTTTRVSSPLAGNVTFLQFQFMPNPPNPASSSWNSSSTVTVTLPGGQTAPLGATYMNNRAPVGVQITISAIDNRSMARLQAIAPAGTNSTNIGAYTNALNQVYKPFTTLVAIPNGQP